MKSFLLCARAGAIGSTLSALLTLYGYFLLSYNMRALDHQALTFFFGPALIVLVMSAYGWFWKVGRVFLTLSLLFIFLALLWHGCLNFQYALFRCFMAIPSCPPVPEADLYGFGLPYVGYLLSSFGLVIAYVAQRSKTGKAVPLSKQN
jgi:hypothetical protein